MDSLKPRNEYAPKRHKILDGKTTRSMYDSWPDRSDVAYGRNNSYMTLGRHATATSVHVPCYRASRKVRRVMFS
jgi:hypothetical protein